MLKCPLRHRNKRNLHQNDDFLVRTHGTMLTGPHSKHTCMKLKLTGWEWFEVSQPVHTITGHRQATISAQHIPDCKSWFSSARCTTFYNRTSQSPYSTYILGLYSEAQPASKSSPDGVYRCYDGIQGLCKISDLTFILIIPIHYADYMWNLTSML